MKTRILPVEEATPEAVASCGQILGRHAYAKPLPIRFYEGAVQTYRTVDFQSDEQTELSLAHVRRRPFEVRWIERHFKHTQTFIPLKGAPFIVPDLDQVRAFRFDGSAGLTMKLGTWHEFPFAIEDEADMVVILRREATEGLLTGDPDSGEVRGADLDKKDLVKRHRLKLKLGI